MIQLGSVKKFRQNTFGTLSGKDEIRIVMRSNGSFYLWVETFVFTAAFLPPIMISVVMR